MTKQVLMNPVLKMLTTWFGLGYVPVAPGTAASIAGVVLSFILAPFSFWYLAVLVVLFAVGVIGSTQLEKEIGESDPRFAVIDEVVGVMVALAGLPVTFPIAICGFFLFRAFDMFKIYPINKFESLPGGWGIMMDDIMAGLYTNIVLHIAWAWAMSR